MNFDEKIAIVDWTHLIEDYLENIGLTFDQFKNEMTGGWLFGYIEALQKVGYSPTFFCFSADRNNIGNHVHAATKAEICVLPSPEIYQFLRKSILNPYTEHLDEAIEKTTPFNLFYNQLLLSIAEYISTPYFKFHQELKDRYINTLIIQDYEHGRFDGLTLLAKLTRWQIFSTFQGGYPTKNKLKSLLRNFSINSAKGLICGSDEEISRFKNDYGLKNNKIAKIFNPLNIEKNQVTNKNQARKKFGIDENAKIAVWHGRIDLHRKGLDLLVEAWQKLCQRNLPFEIRLLLLGYGNQAGEFRLLLDSANNPTIIWFAEYTNDRKKIGEFLSMGDVYVFPSRHEGFPVAPIEGMSYGLPLLATKAQGIAEILENGEESGGVIVELEDVESLASNLEKLFLDDKFRLKLSKNARQRVVESFSLENVGLQLKEFLIKNAK